MSSAKRKKRVVAFGVFDLLHPGHIAFLSAARALGDELIVVVSRDSRVKKEKGVAPVFDEKERLSMIAALAVVSRAVLGDPPGRWGMLERLRPDIVALGHDQSSGIQVRANIRFVRLPAVQRHRYRSTRLRKALAFFGE
jgi:FAD synthetase